MIAKLRGMEFQIKGDNKEIKLAIKRHGTYILENNYFRIEEEDKNRISDVVLKIDFLRAKVIDKDTL